MTNRLRLGLRVASQPDDVTCGPTCLHAVYRHFQVDCPLAQVVREVPMLPKSLGGGTLAVHLANHALGMGLHATIHTVDLQLFDPSWFVRPGVDIAERLRLQAELKGGERLAIASRAYARFLARGGRLRLDDLSSGIIRGALAKGEPVIAGVCATWLYRSVREFGPDAVDSDLRGTPGGHFVVVVGYHAGTRTVRIADPYPRNPLAPGHERVYELPMERFLAAVYLGVTTMDANLLVCRPVEGSD